MKSKKIYNKLYIYKYCFKCVEKLKRHDYNHDCRRTPIHDTILAYMQIYWIKFRNIRNMFEFRVNTPKPSTKASKTVIIFIMIRLTTVKLATENGPSRSHIGFADPDHFRCQRPTRLKLPFDPRGCLKNWTAEVSTKRNQTYQVFFGWSKRFLPFGWGFSLTLNHQEQKRL